MDREISDQKELGSFVHDARIKLGLTQEALAERAGVSRKWLIGLEQGARTRAELGKVLDTFDALGISINLSFNTESETESSKEDHYDSLSGISSVAWDAIRKTSSLDQSPLPKWPSVDVRKSGFKNLAASGFAESPLQKLAKELERRKPFQNLASSELGQSAFKNLAYPKLGQSGPHQVFKRGLAHSGPLASDVDSPATRMRDVDHDQRLPDYHEHNDHEDADDNNE